jgi:predicted site-specific integrase-resolvase
VSDPSRHGLTEEEAEVLANKWYTIAQAAEIVGFTEKTIRKFISQGYLRCKYHHNGRIRIRDKDLARYLLKK